MRQLPYVIDNYAQTLVDVLDDVLDSDAVHALDVATAYFNVGGFDLLCECPGTAFVPPFRGLGDLTATGTGIKCALLVHKYMGFYPVQW